MVLFKKLLTVSIFFDFPVILAMCNNLIYILNSCLWNYVVMISKLWILQSCYACVPNVFTFTDLLCLLSCNFCCYRVLEIMPLDLQTFFYFAFLLKNVLVSFVAVSSVVHHVLTQDLQLEWNAPTHFRQLMMLMGQ